MHESVLGWVADQVARYDLAERRVLEVGSLDVNGSTRELFHGAYLGIDLRPGPGVDVVASGHDVPLEDRSVDVVVCTETLEHDPAFWRTLAEIGRVLRPEGSLLLTTRGNGFGEHREPVDLWRFMPDSMPLLASLAECDVLEAGLDPQVPGVFVHAIRR